MQILARPVAAADLNARRSKDLVYFGYCGFLRICLACQPRKKVADQIVHGRVAVNGGPSGSAEKIGVHAQGEVRLHSISVAHHMCTRSLGTCRCRPPVALPLSWKKLDGIESASQFTDHGCADDDPSGKSTDSTGASRFVPIIDYENVINGAAVLGGVGKPRMS
jgi:hypothetical protein